jgi:hypothetical protein
MRVVLLQVADPIGELIIHFGQQRAGGANRELIASLNKRG